MSYLHGIYLKSWFSWLGEGCRKHSKKRRKQTEEKRRIQGKSNNNNKYHWFYLLYKKLYCSRKHSLKKVVYTITFYLQFLCVARFLKRINRTCLAILAKLFEPWLFSCTIPSTSATFPAPLPWYFNGSIFLVHKVRRTIIRSITFHKKVAQGNSSLVYEKF